MRIMAAAALLLLVSLTAAAAASNTSDRLEKERREETTWRIFTQWKAEHGTTDTSLSEEEKERAYAWFKYCLHLINKHWQDDGYSLVPWEEGRNEEETRQIFAEWKVQSGKTYSSTAEEERRYAIFKDRLLDMDRSNAGFAIGVHRYDRGIHMFPDLTMEELRNLNGYRPPTVLEIEDLASKM